MKIITGDCREVMATEGPFDLIIADPPYGDTSLKWDRKVRGWEAVALARLKPTGSMWVFGSMRYFLAEGLPSGFRYAQDVVWEKHNGSGFAADRFKRVHEHAVQFYRAEARWAAVFNEVQRVPGEANPKKNIKSRLGPAHAGDIRAAGYEYTDTRIARSVLKHPSVRGGPHRTSKPVALLQMLVRTSCPPDGLVGDFFAGFGAAGEAAAYAGRRYVGAEFDPAMADAARARLDSLLFAR